MTTDIKNKADALIKNKGLDDFLRNFGEVFYTGSYALDLMTWRDIDLQVKLYNEQSKFEAISAIFGHMIKDTDVIHMEYTRSTKENNPKMPEGDYLQLRVKEAPGQIWKIDIWMLNDSDFKQNREFVSRMKELLTSDNSIRDLIVNMKYEFMGNNERPPKMASYYLYQAVLFANINDPKEIRQYMKDHGVQI
jgi:hypothetical protein